MAAPVMRAAGRGTRLDLGEERQTRYWRTLVRLARYALPYRGRVALAIVTMFAYSGAVVALPWTIRLAIDGQVMSDEGTFDGLAAVVGLFCLVAAVRFAMGVVHSRTMVKVGQWVLFDVRTRLFEHAQGLSMSFYDRNQVGRIMSRVQNDVQQLEESLSVLVLSLASFVSVIGIAGAMLAMDLLLAAVTLALVAVLIPSLLFWRRFAQQPIRRARETIAGVNSSVQENIAGIRVVQSLNRQQQNTRGFQSVNRENLDASLKSARYRYGLWPSVELLKALAIAMIVFVGGRMIGVSQEVGLLVAFALYAERLFEPIRDLTGDFGHLTGSLVAADRVFELLDVRPEVASAPGAVALPSAAGRVRYEDVSFHYDPESPVLREVSLDVEPGETVALVGPTGAGKTTFVSLLMRLYDVTEGSVSIDGYDVRDLRPESLSRQIGMVPQEPFLFSATVSENIRYNRTDLTDAVVVGAAKAVGAHEFIVRMKDGYDTELDERGGNLSIGQRQLISFARALARDPRILILDEATANVDTETELRIQQALAELLRGRTSFVIAHRLSTVRNADRILVMDGGRIVEQGAHDELLANKGLYHHLHTQSAYTASS